MGNKKSFGVISAQIKIESLNLRLVSDFRFCAERPAQSCDLFLFNYYASVIATLKATDLFLFIRTTAFFTQTISNTPALYTPNKLLLSLFQYCYCHCVTGAKYGTKFRIFFIFHENPETRNTSDVIKTEFFGNSVRNFDTVGFSDFYFKYQQFLV